jgi:hypothetical protein
MRSEVPIETIRAWQSAVVRLRKVENQLAQLTPELRTELLEALTAVDDAWEEHIARVRAWVGQE